MDSCGYLFYSLGYNPMAFHLPSPNVPVLAIGIFQPDFPLTRPPNILGFEHLLSLQGDKMIQAHPVSSKPQSWN